MSKKTKINQIVSQFPALSGHEDMVEFVLDIREASNLEKVPFQLQVGNWSSGSLAKYYAYIDQQRAHEREKNKPKSKTRRKGSPGWVKY